jgi:ABC-type antimicrobial peptide transport system permease subunit
MFFTYLRRELRRRMRQAIFIALGLALGIGLVITVTAASSGVSSSQGTVLHSLYGVGTDVTVTQTPTAGSGGPARFGFGGGNSGSKPSAGTSFSRSVLTSGGLGALPSSDVTKVSGLKDVSATAGALTLTDLKLSGTINAGASGGGAAGGSSSARSSIKSSSFSVTGVDLANGSLGPLSSGTITSGHNFSSADSTANVAVVDASYAKAQNLKTGSAVKVAGTKFTVIGIVSVAQGSASADVYVPLARAQALASMKNKVNTIYVSAASAADIGAVSSEISTALPKATVTTSSDLASEVTGSLSSASSLASNLGTWLAVAVLAAAFGLASLLTVAAVSRRVREFGTLKALGWRNGRILSQIMGEALAIGLIGGAAGVALGFGGAALVQALAPPLTATTTASAPAGPGGAGGTGGGGPGAGGGFARAAQSTAHTVSVHLTAPVTLSVVLLAVVLALAGGLIAGSFGGWRAVRLRPAAALARVV